MDAHSLRVLEFSEVVDCLAAQASSILGRQRATTLRPSPDPDLVAQRLAETRECHALLGQGPLPPLERIADIREPVRRATIPGVRLSPQELLAIADTLEVALHLRRHLRAAQLHMPELSRIAAGLVPPVECVAEIRRCITADGAVADEASPALLRLRADARRMREAVRETLQAILQSPSLQPILAEPIITLRNDRYVIPVTPGYRGYLQGIVQDQSASGQTLFVEPLPTVDMNNAIRRLEREAEAEMDRLLGELTSMVRAVGQAIASTVEALADLDLILAKARLAQRWHGTEPRILREGAMRLVGLRHPLLLEQREVQAHKDVGRLVIPITVMVGLEARVLVITGPNTGGKTVALKAVGLAVLMTQAGLFIPASADSQLPVYASVYADIGDQQSIAEDLSTFSAHVERLKTVLHQADPKSLVLLDEIGAGTDPGEGSALGNAVLESLADRGCHVLATTHLGAIKAFVAQDPRMMNAAVEFDLDSLRPLYTLSIGLPGRSFAIDIACRLGLPPIIIQRSRELLGDSGAEVTALLSRLQIQERQRDAEAAAAAQDRAAAAAARQVAERLAADLRGQVAAVRGQAKRLVTQIATEARRRAEAIFAEVSHGASIQQAREAIGQLAQEANARLAELPSTEPSPPGHVDPSSVKPGQRVLVRHLDQTGRVLSEPTSQGVVEIQLRVGKTRVPVDALAPVPTPAPASSGLSEPAAMGGVTWRAGAGDSLAAEINVIGCTVDEATNRVQRYVEDAALGGLTQVRIIHGKGTGRLRRGIAEFLKTHPLVAGFHLASFEEGGAGATIVDLGRREDGESPPREPASQNI